MKNPARQGFSLIELLVVIAIIGVLIALGLAAAQRVRQAAYQVQCADHLRQIGLALHGFHDSKGALPSGVRANSKTEPYPNLDWQALILPFMDQQVLWQKTEEAFALDNWVIDNPPHVGLSTPLSMYICPLEPRPTVETVQYGVGGGKFKTREVAITSYLGVLGTNNTKKDGCLFVNSAIRLSDITDGTSHTLLVGERPPSPDFHFGVWYSGGGTFGSGNSILGVADYNIFGFLGYDCPDGPYAFGPGRIDDKCDTFHYWSLHMGGANFLLADGSVQFFPYSASSVMPALATRAGGETTGDY